MIFPHVRMAADPHERLGVRRADPTWLDQRWSDPTSRVLVVSGTHVRPVDGRPDWSRPDQAPEGTRVLLGERQGTTYFAVLTSSARAREEDGWYALRDLLPVLSTQAVDQAPLLFHALGIAEWHAATRFCPRDGAPLEARASGHELQCTRCGRRQFPRSDPAVIMTVTTGEPGSTEERCLLGHQAVWPAGRYSTLAGFCEPGETLEDAVRREVAEETGIAVGEVSYFGNQPWPLPASLMLGFIGRALSTEIVVDRDEIEDARWFTRAELAAEAEAGTIALPGDISISRALIEHWYGGRLPGSW